jgi:hypothetical protein
MLRLTHLMLCCLVLDCAEVFSQQTISKRPEQIERQLTALFCAEVECLERIQTEEVLYLKVSGDVNVHSAHYFGEDGKCDSLEILCYDSTSAYLVKEQIILPMGGEWVQVKSNQYIGLNYIDKKSRQRRNVPFLTIQSKEGTVVFRIRQQWLVQKDLDNLLSSD